MSYVITHFWPGATEEQYNRTREAAHPDDGLPEGQIYHVAGPTEGGFLVVAVWDSKDSYETFVREKLMGGPPVEGGMQGPPEERTAQVARLETA